MRLIRRRAGRQGEGKRRSSAAWRNEHGNDAVGDRVIPRINAGFRLFCLADLGLFGFIYVNVLLNPFRDDSLVNAAFSLVALAALLGAAYFSAPRRQRRNRLFGSLLLGLALFQAATALVMLAHDRTGNLWRSVMSVHAVVGFEMFAPFFLVYYFRHIGNRREGVAPLRELNGHLSFFIFRVGFWSGVVTGLAAGPPWLIPLHRWGMLVGTPLLLWHVNAAARDRLRQDDARAQIVQRAAPALLLPLVLVAAGYLWLRNDPRPKVFMQSDLMARGDPTPLSTGYRFEPSEVRTAGGAVYREEVLTNSAKSCGGFGCHKVIYEAWLESPHRHSANVFYEAALQLAFDKKGLDGVKFCAGCHDPVSLLSGGLKAGRLVSAAGREEGITCIICHSIEPHGADPKNAAYTFRMPERFFTTVQNIYTAHQLREEHLGDFLQPALRATEYCVACHRVVLPRHLTGAPRAIVEQDPYTSWREGPFHDRSHPRFVRIETCQSCHMPRTTKQERPVPLSPDHRFAAANSALPVLYGYPSQLEAVERFLRDGQVSLRIESVRREKDEILLAIRVESRRVGHVFPAGPLDINEVWIEVTVEDTEGARLFYSGGLDEKGRVETGARFFKSLKKDSEGREIRGHDILSVATKEDVRLLPPRGARRETYAFSAPRGAKGLVVEARLNYRKFNPDFVAFAVGRSLSLPVVTMARDRREVRW